MNKKKLYVVDTYSTNYFHEMFNAGLLEIVIREADEVIYCASSSSQKNVLALLKKERRNKKLSSIKCHSLYVVHREIGVGALLRVFVSAFQNIIHLFRYRKFPLLLMHNDALSIGWLSILNLVLKRPVWIVCHGELELLLERPRCYKPSFWFKQLFKLFFHYLPLSPNLHFIVLGESIKKNLQKCLPARCENLFVSIPHPYFFSTVKNIKNSNTDELRLGTTGCMNVAKGYERLVALSELLKEPIRQQRLSIFVIGRLEGICPDRGTLLNFSGKSSEMLSREKYVEKISKLRYILFFYGIDSYKLTASGAIFDALSLEKPIIALKNDFFESIFEQCGEIGYLCNTVEEMCDRIEGLLLTPNESVYNTFVTNMRQARKMFYPENIRLNLF